MRRILAIFLVMMVGQLAQAQKADSTKYLLTDFALQLEITDAIDDMYNFDFFLFP